MSKPGGFMERAGPPARDRRSARRFDTAGSLPGQIGIDLDTDVVQISLSGMLVETPVALSVGSRHEFVLGIGNEEIEVCGVVRNCCRHPAEGGASGFRVGIEFVDLSERHREVLERFIEQKT